MLRGVAAVCAVVPECQQASVDASCSSVSKGVCTSVCLRGAVSMSLSLQQHMQYFYNMKGCLAHRCTSEVGEAFMQCCGIEFEWLQPAKKVLYVLHMQFHLVLHRYTHGLYILDTA